MWSHSVITTASGVLEQILLHQMASASSIRQTCAVSRAEWEAHKDEITTLFQKDGLKQVMRAMSEKYAFNPTKEQYKHQLRKWDERKNMKADEAERLGIDLQALEMLSPATRRKVKRFQRRRHYNTAFPQQQVSSNPYVIPISQAALPRPGSDLIDFQTQPLAPTFTEQMHDGDVLLPDAENLNLSRPKPYAVLNGLPEQPVETTRWVLVRLGYSPGQSGPDPGTAYTSESMLSTSKTTESACQSIVQITATSTVSSRAMHLLQLFYNDPLNFELRQHASMYDWPYLIAQACESAWATAFCAWSLDWSTRASRASSLDLPYHVLIVAASQTQYCITTAAYEICFDTLAVIDLVRYGDYTAVNRLRNRGCMMHQASKGKHCLSSACGDEMLERRWVLKALAWKTSTWIAQMQECIQEESKAHRVEVKMWTILWYIDFMFRLHVDDDDNDSCYSDLMWSRPFPAASSRT